MFHPRGLVPAVVAVAGSVLPVGAVEEGGGGLGQQLITPQFGTMFWTLATFVVLVWLLKRVAWRHLIGAVEQREKNIQESLDRAKKEREEAEALARQNRELLDQARRERAEAVEAGRQDAEKLKGEILEEARRQREQLVSQAESQISATVRQAKQELRGATVDLAIQAAAKLLARNLDEASQRKLVEDYLADLERTSPEVRS